MGDKEVWVWIALCRKTRQVVAYAAGDRRLPDMSTPMGGHSIGLSSGVLLHGLWAPYAAVIPEEQHTAVGKETGETAHVERWNNTLCQRLARFVRMTLSFSKSGVIHEACLLLFLHRYKRELAILLK